MKPLTLATHSSFCYLPSDPPLPCQFLYLKYWLKLYFNWSAQSYCIRLSSLSPDKVAMKERMQSWFQVLIYEDRLSAGEVPPIKVKKMRIGTHVILIAICFKERREIFCDNRVSIFLMCMIVFCIYDG